MSSDAIIALKFKTKLKEVKSLDMKLPFVGQQTGECKMSVSEKLYK